MVESPHRLRELQSEGCYHGKDEVGATRTSSTKENGKLRQYHIPERITDLCATIKGLREVEVMIPTTSPFISPRWPVQKTDGS